MKIRRVLWIFHEVIENRKEWAAMEDPTVKKQKNRKVI